MDWNSICGPKNGGLGFRPLKNMNLALLGKWLWRIGENVVSLWKDIILASMGWDGMGGTFLAPPIDLQVCGEDYCSSRMLLCLLSVSGSVQGATYFSSMMFGLEIGHWQLNS